MTQPLVEVYIFFNGYCDEALAFYKKAVGAEVEFLMRYNESPESVPAGMLAPGFENKVMHTSFRIGGTRVMASDGCAPGEGFQGFSLSLTLATEADVEKAFNGLAEGGTVTMPLGKTFWSPCFGMLTDRFGMGWMLSVAAESI